MRHWVGAKVQSNTFFSLLLRNLKYGFLSKSSIWTGDAIVKWKVRGCIAKEFEDAKRKQESCHHWGNVGWVVERAA
ncbi:hypothetical protein OAH87_07130, partial [Marinomonas sp.]